MAAARLRQAATRLASAVAASDTATSRPVRVIGKTLAVGAAGGATYSAAGYALSETVPYGGDGGRRRGPDSGIEPLWATLLASTLGNWPRLDGTATAAGLKEHGHAEVQEQASWWLGELGHCCACAVHGGDRSTSPASLAAAIPNGLLIIMIPIPLQLGPDGLAPVPAGEVRVHWMQPPEGKLEEAAEVAYSEPFQEAVEASMAAVLAALQQEAKEKGFGMHVLVSAAAVYRLSVCMHPRTTVLCIAALPCLRTAILSRMRPGGSPRHAPIHFPNRPTCRSADSISLSRPTRSSLARPRQAMQ